VQGARPSRVVAALGGGLVGLAAGSGSLQPEGGFLLGG